MADEEQNSEKVERAISNFKDVKSRADTLIGDLPIQTSADYASLRSEMKAFRPARTPRKGSIPSPVSADESRTSIPIAR